VRIEKMQGRGDTVTRRLLLAMLDARCSLLDMRNLVHLLRLSVKPKIMIELRERRQKGRVQTTFRE